MELEATNYFFSIGDDENVLELTFNHDGRTYERWARSTGTSRSASKTWTARSRLAEQGIGPERRTKASEARHCACAAGDAVCAKW